MNNIYMYNTINKQYNKRYNKYIKEMNLLIAVIN